MRNLKLVLKYFFAQISCCDSGKHTDRERVSLKFTFFSSFYPLGEQKRENSVFMENQNKQQLYTSFGDDSLEFNKSE